MTLPRFAVVTPSFNQAEFLEQTIKSVLEQEGLGTDFEIDYAVIDGGSSDDSNDVIRKYESELTFWCSEKDRGQTHAINKGFEQVSGNIHAYINSDDYYLPGAFKQVAKAAAANPDDDLFHGTCQKVDAEGVVFKTQRAQIESLDQHLNLWDYWLRPKENWNFIQPEVFWTDRLSRKIGNFDESLFYTMDYNYWLRGFDAGMTVRFIDAELAAFRVHEAQKTTQRDASIRELISNVEPFVADPDPRIETATRAHILRQIQLTLCQIENADARPRQQIAALTELAASQPKLLQSKHFWKQFRRSGRRMFMPHRSAA